MLGRRRVLMAAGALAAPAVARAQETPGVTATEIRIGSTNSLSGPLSSYSVISRCTAAMFKRQNDEGGIAGRKINFIVYDDGFQPPKTLEQARRLIEQDKVAFLFNTLGTATNSAIQRYVNARKVPHLFLATGADKWANPQEFPWTIGWQPSYRVEAQIYAKHILEQKPDAKVALLYQNDDFGKDFINGLKDVLGARYEATVRGASYEATDPNIDSQVVSLQQAGAEVVVLATAPKFAAMAIRKIHDIGWRPLSFVANIASSAGAVMNTAGAEKGIGVITSDFRKDHTDPAWAEDAGMNAWRGFMRQYLPDGDLADNNYTLAYGFGMTMLQTLKQCGNDFSRENVMRQATSLAPFEVPTLLPGIMVSTTPRSYRPVRQMQLQRWDGRSWLRFGKVIEGADV